MSDYRDRAVELAKEQFYGGGIRWADAHDEGREATQKVTAAIEAAAPLIAEHAREEAGLTCICHLLDAPHHPRHCAQVIEANRDGIQEERKRVEGWNEGRDAAPSFPEWYGLALEVGMAAQKMLASVEPPDGETDPATVSRRSITELRESMEKLDRTNGKETEDAIRAEERKRVEEALLSDEAVGAVIQLLSERGWGILSGTTEPVPDLAALRSRCFADFRAAIRAALQASTQPEGGDER